jgi:hypothetical protein
MSEALMRIEKKGDISSQPSAKETPIIRSNNDSISIAVSTEQPEEIALHGETISPKGFNEKFSLNIFDTQIAKDSVFRLQEGNYIEPWKLVEDVSARLIDQYDEVVVLECLIDPEAKIYMETELEKSLFDGYQLQVGALFKVSKYSRKNENRFVVRANPLLVSITDFPKVDFDKKYDGNFFNPE